MNIQSLLEKSARSHSHLCPRQILGVRLGLCGMQALGFDSPPDKKRLLVIAETDGCFADGLSAATDCTVGHRTLRVEDYGKTAAAFVDIQTGRALRVAPALDIRARACTSLKMNRGVILRRCSRIKPWRMKRCSPSPKWALHAN